MIKALFFAHFTKKFRYIKKPKSFKIRTRFLLHEKIEDNLLFIKKSPSLQHIEKESKDIKQKCKYQRNAISFTNLPSLENYEKLCKLKEKEIEEKNKLRNALKSIQIRVNDRKIIFNEVFQNIGNFKENILKKVREDIAIRETDKLKKNYFIDRNIKSLKQIKLNGEIHKLQKKTSLEICLEESKINEITPPISFLY